MTATDADDPTYGNSARVVYSIIHGHPYFSVEPKTGNFYFVNISEQFPSEKMVFDSVKDGVTWM